MAIKFKLSDEEKKKINKIATAMEEEKQATRETEVSQGLPTAKLSRLSERNNSYSSRTKYPYTNKYGKGNIDLTNRPIVKNDDGSISTVRSMSFQDEEGKEVLVPTVVNGKIVSDSEAINNYYRTGEYLGKFDSVEEANEYAKELHRQQEKLYSKNNQQIYELPKAGFIANSRRTGKISNPFSDSRLINTLKKENETLKTVKEDLQPLGESSISSQTYEDMKSNDPKVSFPAKTRYLIDTAKGAITGWGRSIGQYLQTSVADDNQRVLDNKILAKFTDENGRKRLEETNKNLVEQIRKTQADKNADAIASQELSPTMQTLGDISRSLGNVAPTMALNAIIPGAGNVAMFMSSSGNASGEALLRENDIRKAKLAGDLKGAIEVGAEKLTGGIKFLPKGTLDNTAVNFISKNIKSKVGQKIASKGYEVGGEVLEEVLTDIGQNTVDKFMYQDDGKVVDFDQLKETAKITVLTTLALNALGLGGSTYKEVQQQNKTNEVNSRIDEAQKVINGDGYITQEQQTINQANNNTNVEQNLPTVNTENTYSNQLKQMASKEITNSNISEDYKTMMLDVLNSMNEVSDADISSIRQNINSLEDANNNKEKIRSILKRNGTFSEQIDKYVENKLPSGDFLYLGETPTILKKIGLNNEEMVLKQGKLKSIIKESSDGTDQMHGLPIETIKKIPEAIANPLNVLQSSSNKDSIVVITDLADTNERPIIASIEVNYNGQIGNIDFLSNRLTSAYGKNNYDRFMKTEIAKGNLLYDIDEGIIKELPTTRLQLPKGISSSVDTNNNISTINNSISQNNNSVKNTTTNNYMQKKQNNSNELETGEINNVINETRSSQNIQNSVEKNNIKEYNNLQLGETKNININDLSQLAKDGGHRTTEQIESLRESIRQNGIVEPIEIYRKNDGTFAIENGNHRLKIASELGIEQVPVKLVESWENLGLVKDKTETNILNEGIDGSDTSNRISETNIENDEGSGTGRRSVYDINDKFKNGRTAEKNVGISEGTPNSNQQTSNIKNEGNNRKQGVDDSTSFNMNESSEKQDTSNELGEWTKQKKDINPSEISSLSKEDSSTTPKINPKKYEKGNRQSNFYENVVKDSQFINKDFREEMSKDENIRYYKGITNEQTLQKAYESLKDGGKEETLSWFSKNEKNVKAEDVAKGWILLKQYQDAGDYQGAVEVAKKMRQMGTNAGQAVQAYNILSRLTPEGMFYYAQSELNEAYSKMVEGKSKQWIEANQDKFNLTQEETQTILDTMKEVASLEDGREKNIKLAQIQKLVSDKIPPTTGQSVKAWMRISMLFNPKTQVRNVMGNAVVLPVNATSDVFAGALDKLISKKTGVRTTGVTKEGVKGYAKGFKKGVFESYDDFRKGINTRNVEGNRFEIGEGKSFKDKGIGKTLNRVDNMLSFALDVGDRGFYEATYTNSINNQMILNNTTEITQDMIDIATNEALQRTWQDSNNYTQAVLSIRKILNKVNVKGYGLGDVLIPFAKTPANLTKAIVDYSPVGLTKTLAFDAKRFTNSLQNGQYSPQLQHDFVQNVGKGLAGTMLYTLGYALAKAGIATGEPDDDKDVKNFMKNSLGISSYSIKIGDKSFTYDWAQPVATPLAIMTNYVKYSKDNPDASAIDKAIKAMNIGTEQLLQQSFMESLNTVLNGNGTTLENLSQAVLELPARAVPTFCKQIADMVDGTQRSSFEYGQPIKSAINSVKAKIPGLSQTLPASVDTLGNDIQKYGGNNNLWNVMLNPANTNKGQLTKTGQEIYNVYMNTGDSTIFPRTAPYYINNKGEKITMSSEQRNKFQRVSGKYVEESLDSLLNNKDYKNLNNNEKASIINEIVSDSYSKAKYDVLEIDSKEYLKTREILKNVSPSTYYNYKIITKGLKKDNDKIDKLVNSNYSNNEKTVLYETYILSDSDTKYPIIKNTFTENGLNITKYLQYKLQKFTSDKKDDGTVNGKSITGSKKDKVFDYIDSIKGATYTQKLILYALEYKPSSASDREIIENHVRNLPNKTAKEKIEIMSKFAGVTVYKNDSYTY